MVIKINDVNISNDVVANSFNYISRIDDVFGTGELQFESKTITNNIPPYSILKIDDVSYCCSSEASYHFGRNSWFHKVSIIEATSLLSRFLIGSKAFSITGTNAFDHEKINVLLELINTKYNVNIYLTQEITDIFTKKIEYVFGAGTTLFDALNEICRNYNIKLNVSDVVSKNIAIELIYLNDDTIIDTSQLNMLSKIKIQNPENYCKYLEIEATNVIDTNQQTIVSNIYPTADGVQLNEDTFLLKTPTKIYELEKFEIIKTQGNIMDTKITLSNNIPFFENDGEHTFNYWSNKWPFLNAFYKNVYAKYYPDKKWFYEQNWIAYESNGVKLLAPLTHIAGISLGQLENAEIPLDYSSYIVSKEHYELLEDKDKPNYAYYTSGTNRIEGFNTFYKNDFWNSVLGYTATPFIFEPIGTNYVDTSGEGFNISLDAFISTFQVRSQVASKGPFNHFYRVTYKPVANPYLLNTKQETPLNETNYKPYALSYNKSSNYIDFDKLNNSMTIENKSLGRVEMVVEYEFTDNNFNNIETRGKIYVDGFSWYIASCEIKYNATQIILRYNLIRNYSKLADVIALNSQYNTLKNPLENIIERPIIIKTDEEFEIENGNTYIGLRFYDKQGNFISQYDDEWSSLSFRVLPAIIFKDDNDIYLYCEMLDQYSVGRNSQNYDAVKKISDVKYVDENNEFYKVDISIMNIQGFSLEATKKLPYIKLELNYQDIRLELNDIVVYKDAREKLTFTIKCNNCIIK